MNPTRTKFDIVLDEELHGAFTYNTRRWIIINSIANSYLTNLLQKIGGTQLMLKDMSTAQKSVNDIRRIQDMFNDIDPRDEIDIEKTDRLWKELDRLRKRVLKTFKKEIPYASDEEYSKHMAPVLVHYFVWLDSTIPLVDVHFVIKDLQNYAPPQVRSLWWALELYGSTLSSFTKALKENDLQQVPGHNEWNRAVMSRHGYVNKVLTDTNFKKSVKNIRKQHDEFSELVLRVIEDLRSLKAAETKKILRGLVGL